METAIECSPECQALKDFAAGMDPDKLTQELVLSGRFTDDDAATAVAAMLTGSTEPVEPADGEAEDAVEADA